VTRPDLSVHGNNPALSFTEGGSAARYEAIRRLLPARAASQLPQFIAESGSPDQAVLYLEVLLQQHFAEAMAAFESSGLALRSAVALFGSTQWLSQTLLQNPDLLQLFARPPEPGTVRGVEDFREQLARFRFGLIILDPAYKVLGNRDENAKYCGQSGAQLAPAGTEGVRQ